MFISLTAISVTVSDTFSVASRTRTELTRSKCKWTRIYTIYNVDETNQGMLIMNMSSDSHCSIQAWYDQIYHAFEVELQAFLMT